LQKQGYIKGFRAIVDPVKLGREHVAFVEVRLSDTRESALQAFNQAVLNIPEIEQCHMIAGSFDYLLKVRTSEAFAVSSEKASPSCRMLQIRLHL
jgi:Lrp/AsnC family leucine-responsive transcriptional regulator